MDVPLVKVGGKVMLQFEGWPTVQFSGWPQVVIGTFEGEVIFISPQKLKDSLKYLLSKVVSESGHLQMY